MSGRRRAELARGVPAGRQHWSRDGRVPPGARSEATGDEERRERAGRTRVRRRRVHDFAARRVGFVLGRWQEVAGSSRSSLEFPFPLVCGLWVRLPSGRGLSFFFRNREYISYKFLVVYIPPLTKTLSKIKQITIKSS